MVRRHLAAINCEDCVEVSCEIPGTRIPPASGYDCCTMGDCDLNGSRERKNIDDYQHVNDRRQFLVARRAPLEASVETILRRRAEGPVHVPTLTSGGA